MNSEIIKDLGIYSIEILQNLKRYLHSNHMITVYILPYKTD